MGWYKSVGNRQSQLHLTLQQCQHDIRVISTEVRGSKADPFGKIGFFGEGALAVTVEIYL